MSGTIDNSFATDARTAYIELSALCGGYLDLPEREFITDPDPNAVNHCPSLCFHILHKNTGERIVFDLGMRKDWEIGPIPEKFTSGTRTIDVTRDVRDSLLAGGIHSEEV
jgi:hypothetical protein